LLKLETENSEAYNLYIQGRYQWAKLTKESLESSIEFFRQAVDKDPGYSLAYSGLADAYSVLGEGSHVRPKEAFEKARFYAEKALALDKSLAEAWLSLGIVRLFFDWDWTGAHEALSRAKELDPHKAHVYHFYAHYLQIIGRTSEAVIETEQGINREPASPYLNAELTWAYYWNDQYDEALTQALRTQKLDPGPYSVISIVQPYEQQGRYADALSELNKVTGDDAKWSWIVGEVGYVHAKLGNRAEAQKVLRELQSRADGEWIDPVLIAWIYIALDNKDEAFRWLDKAFEEHSGWMPWLKIEPKFDPVRDDPRFRKLLRGIGLSS
jgi:tetratricopeptide (TPR) repeat protein